MAREVLITVGSLGAVAVGVLSGPATGVWAPHRRAALLHAASTAGLLGGVALLRPRLRPTVVG